MPTLSDAITAIKAGRRDEARVMLTRILADDGNNVTALLWLTEVAKTPEERRTYLKRILAIDPNNAAAGRGLDLLGKADKPLPPTAAQPLTRQPTSADTADDYRMSPDERKPQHAPVATPELVGVPTNNTSNVNTVTGIIIVFQIIVVLFWAVIGYSQIRIAYLEVMTAYDLTDAIVNQSRLLTLASIFSFILAVANLVVIKSVMQHHRRAYRRLIRLAEIGGVGAFILAIIGSPSAIIGVPLCIIVAYLASTIKEAFSQ